MRSIILYFISRRHTVILFIFYFYVFLWKKQNLLMYKIIDARAIYNTHIWQHKKILRRKKNHIFFSNLVFYQAYINNI
jgi:hypothetical protein